MENKLLQFKELNWDSNPFKILEKSNSNMRIKFEHLSLSNNSKVINEIEFKNPRSEWASLWNEKINEWQEHPDMESPIGENIIEAFVKPVGTVFKFSFAGNHQLGWSRWGFTSDSFELITKT